MTANIDARFIVLANANCSSGRTYFFQHWFVTSTQFLTAAVVGKRDTSNRALFVPLIGKTLSVDHIQYSTQII